MIDDIVMTALGLSGPEALAIKLGAMVVSDLLKRPQAASQGGDQSILSSTPGRVRLAASGLKGSPRLARRIEGRVGQLPGVEKISANTRTGTVLVVFDPDLLDSTQISRAVWLAGRALRVVTPDPRYQLSPAEVSVA